MTFDYASLRDNTAEPLIARFGKSALLHTPSGAPAEPWEPMASETDAAVTVVEINPEARDRDGTLIREDDVMFLVSTDGDPDIGLAQSMTVEGVRYRVVGIKPVRPGSVVVLWKAHCRK